MAEGFLSEGPGNEDECLTKGHWRIALVSNPGHMITRPLLYRTSYRASSDYTISSCF